MIYYTIDLLLHNMSHSCFTLISISINIQKLLNDIDSYFTSLENIYKIVY